MVRPKPQQRWSKRSRRAVLVILGCLLLTAYFAQHIITGRHGLEARSRLIARASMLDTRIRSLEAARSSLRVEVRLLRPDPPDADIVEEIAAEVLGFVRPGDTIAMRSAPRAPQPR